MDILKSIINLTGLLLIVWIVWYFWLSKQKGAAVTERAGLQEVSIKVKGGYEPNIITVKKGIPVKMHFTRQESSACSEMVIFDKINQSAKLPEGQTVIIEFTPQEEGEIPFQCQMGMLRGKIIVKA